VRRPSSSPRVNWRRLANTLFTDLAVLSAATFGVFVLQEWLGLQGGSAVYLLAVALVAYLQGSWAAISTAVGAFLIYNFLFIEPRFTFSVASGQGLLTLATLLALGTGIGRLTGLLRDRARESDRREREARSLFAVSRAIATARRTADALPAVVERIAAETAMRRVWVGLGTTVAQERTLADSTPAEGPITIGPHQILSRSDHEDRSTWVRLSPPALAVGARPGGATLYRVELRDDAEVIGSLWAAREAPSGPPTLEETRLMAVAADQVGQGLLRDRLAEQATELEVTRRSDELKAALLDSVSHDLRTPLGTIRAAAGSLADAAISWAPGDREAMASQIDAEAERLARLVGDLLDMSRIEGGALQPRCEPIPVGDLVLPALERVRPHLGERQLEVDLPDALPPVDVDPVLIDQVMTNLLENAARHGGPGAPIRISAQEEGELVLLRVEDGGPGVPATALPRLFEKFYRVPQARDSARRGSGLGLALVKGLTEAMGGTVTAGRSALGGLAVDLRLRTAEPSCQ
jgi:two-component system, OmpR family, sensor histidine kinase KdpD